MEFEFRLAKSLRKTLNLDCKMSKWIKVEDMPPNCEKVLAIHMSKEGVLYNMRHDGWFRNTIYSCRINSGDFIIESHGPCFPATHWMPLPELPEKLDKSK